MSLKYIKGFTLLELAIVLVIIGLLVGGVLTGQSLIEKSKVNKTISKLELYNSSINTFNDKYSCLPGDCEKAESFFGASATDNGDGNRLIRYFGTNEDEMVFQHLALSGLIDGVYSNAGLEPGVSTPPTPFGGGYWVSYEHGTTPVYGRSYFSHFIELAGYNSSNPYLIFSLFTPQQAYSIDLKFDDGKANSGKMITLDGFELTGCIDGVSYSYITSSNTVSCRIIWWPKY